MVRAQTLRTPFQRPRIAGSLVIDANAITIDGALGLAALARSLAREAARLVSHQGSLLRLGEFVLVALRRWEWRHSPRIG